MELPQEPTGDECYANANIGNGWFAIWYPQMGGYCSHAAVWIDPNGCFECFVWHDGEFPFRDGDIDGFTDLPKQVRQLHHCDAEQFIQFGQTVMRLQQHSEDQ